MPATWRSTFILVRVGTPLTCPLCSILMHFSLYWTLLNVRVLIFIVSFLHKHWSITPLTLTDHSECTDVVEPTLSVAHAKELELIFLACPQPDISMIYTIARRLDIPEAQVKVISLSFLLFHVFILYHSNGPYLIKYLYICFVIYGQCVFLIDT